MTSRRRGFALLVFTLLAACASPGKLARQSSAALNAGDLRKAYDKALHAIEKDPQHQAGRSAYAAASRRMDANYRDRVLARATTDTIAAANLVFEARRFRAEVARHETVLDAQPDYERVERAILTGAARSHFNRGVDAMAARRPKQAVSEFSSARAYDESFPGLAARLADARRQATVRVALIPFSDDVAVPGLSREIGDTVQRELTRRAGEFRFTQIVPGEEVERNVTLAELRTPNAELAIEIGRRVGADWVVVGHFHDLHARSSERSLTFPLFHRVDVKDSKGVVTGFRWDETSLRTVTRRRDVSIDFEFEVIDVATGAILAHKSDPAEVAARVAWTDFRPTETHYDRYALVPPDVRKAEPERARKADQQWHDLMGSWDLDDFLRAAREQRGRSRYASRYRDDFYSDTRNRPAWLGELPSENDLAFVALRDVWQTVVNTLKGMDAKD